MAASEYIEEGKPLSQQAKWSDVRPEPSSTNGLLQIQFSPGDRELFQYFLAICAAEEKSERALAITEAVIGVNSASYHAWSYRWACLEALNDCQLLLSEQKFLERIAAVNVKNYQLWNHRRRVAFALGIDSGLAELDFAEQCLANDPKNYHSWAHRQAVVEKFGFWEEEMMFTEQMLHDDVRNNSAWNQRFFVLLHSQKHTGEELATLLKSELAFAACAILKAPHNESPWNYVRGLASLSKDCLFLAQDLQLQSLCQEVLQELPSCSPALSLLADVFVAQMQMSAEQQDHETALATGSLACQCYDRLRITDPIRENYWKFSSELATACMSRPELITKH